MKAYKEDCSRCNKPKREHITLHGTKVQGQNYGWDENVGTTVYLCPTNIYDAIGYDYEEEKRFCSYCGKQIPLGNKVGACPSCNRDNR